jgi:hypothetical protein
MPRGSRRLPAECVRQLAAADVILHAGDFVSAAVLDELLALGPVEAVRGNGDDAALRAALPERRVVEIAEARIGMVHDPGRAIGRGERLAAAFPGCSAVVYGHTHAPDVTRVGSTLVLNPGSPTERRRAPTRSMLLLHAVGDRLDAQLVPLP